MKITFIQDIPFAYLGLMHLSSMLKNHGHETSVVITSEHKKYLDVITRENPDIVGFSCITGLHPHLLQIASEVKARINVPVIFGGPHPSFHPQILEQPQVDYICIGEAEDALLELMTRLEKGGEVKNIENIWLKRDGEIVRNPLRPLVLNLDSLPFPDREFYRNYGIIQDSHFHFFRVSRGCPYPCTYCHQHAKKRLYGDPVGFVRFRNPENIIHEMKELMQYKEVSFINFTDDCINSDLPWLFHFLEIYSKEIRIPFHCQGVFENFSEEAVKALKNAGCHAISCGLESGDPYIRSNVIRKNQSIQEILEHSGIIKRSGIRLRVYNVIGFPEETLTSALSTLELNLKLKPDIAWASLFQPYPGTDAAEYAKNKGFLPENFSFDMIERTFRIRSVLILKQKREIVNVEKLFVVCMMFPFLFSLMKYLVKIPNNFIYDLIHLFTYGLQIKKLENLSYIKLITVGCKAFKAKA